MKDSEFEKQGRELTESKDAQLRKEFPSNVEGSVEFNLTNQIERLEDDKKKLIEVLSYVSSKLTLEQNELTAYIEHVLSEHTC